MIRATQAGVELVGEAADGEAALTTVERLRPNVILMDLAMPRVDGIDATRLLTETSLSGDPEPLSPRRR
jgi:YesN/AraC family two-component response regulator